MIRDECKGIAEECKNKISDFKAQNKFQFTKHKKRMKGTKNLSKRRHKGIGPLPRSIIK